MGLSRLGVARRILALTLIGSLAFSGCSSSGDDAENAVAPPVATDDEAQNSDEAQNAGSAVLDLGDESYTFVLAFCVMTDDDLFAHGPGRNNVTSEVAYVDADFVRDPGTPSGAVSIDIGATQHMKTTDEQVTFDMMFDEDHSITFGDDTMTIEGGFWRDNPQDQTPGTFTLNCS